MLSNRVVLPAVLKFEGYAEQRFPYSRDCWECGEGKEDVKRYVVSSQGNWYLFCDNCADQRLGPALAQKFRDRGLKRKEVVPL